MRLTTTPTVLRRHDQRPAGAATTPEGPPAVAPEAASPDADATAPRVRLRLLGGFALSVDGARRVVAPGAQRLLAWTSLYGTAARRAVAAGQLWGDTDETRAHANLRSALWRVRRIDDALIETDADRFRLHRDVDVDATRMVTLARDEVRGRRPALAVDAEVSLLTGDLLPGWYEDWLVFKQEQLRQLALHGLEALCARMLAEGALQQAVEVAAVAVQREPLRETAHRWLIRAHLAEGNVGEAVRQFRALRRVLERELGISPSPTTAALIDGAIADRGVRPPARN